MTPHQRLIDRLAAGALKAEDRAHAAQCAACAALLSPGQATEPPAPAQQWLAAAHRELARPQRSGWLLALGLAALNTLWAAAAVFVLQAWNWDVSTAPRWLFLSVASTLALGVTAGAVLALVPGRQWQRLGRLLAAVAPLAVLLAADGRAAGGRFFEGMSCFWTVVFLSLVPLAAGAWLLTRMAYSAARAFTVGLASAGVGLLVLQFHCANGTSAHLFAFHFLPWVVVGGLAVLLRKLLPTWSHAP
jgi:hypothetical protein